MWSSVEAVQEATGMAIIYPREWCCNGRGLSSVSQVGYVLFLSGLRGRSGVYTGKGV